jgi:hypothetical protein
MKERKTNGRSLKEMARRREMRKWTGLILLLAALASFDVLSPGAWTNKLNRGHGFFCSGASIISSETEINIDHITDTIFAYFEKVLMQQQQRLSKEQKELIHQCRLGQADAIFSMAKLVGSPQPEGRPFGAPSDELSLYLYTYAADVKDHTLAQARLGRIYAEGNKAVDLSISKAVHYYQKAGANGHHASLYNTGLLLFEAAQPPDLVGAIAYFHAAATLHDTYPELEDPKMSVIATQAHEKVSIAAATAVDLTIREVADIFVYGVLKIELDNKVEKLWRESVSAQMAFNETFVESRGAERDIEQLKKAEQALSKLIDSHTKKMTNLQLYLALDNLNDVLGPLVEDDVSYLPEAARRAEALLSSPMCWLGPPGTGCSPRAAYNALSYYERAGNRAGVKRISELGSNPAESEL